MHQKDKHSLSINRQALTLVALWLAQINNLPQQVLDGLSETFALNQVMEWEASKYWRKFDADDELDKAHRAMPDLITEVV